MSTVPTSSRVPSTRSMASASIRAMGSPRRRMPTSATPSTPLLRSMISCAMRVTVRRIWASSISCVFFCITRPSILAFNRFRRHVRRTRRIFSAGKSHFPEEKILPCRFCGQRPSASSKIWRGWSWRGSLLPCPQAMPPPAGRGHDNGAQTRQLHAYQSPCRPHGIDLKDPTAERLAPTADYYSGALKSYMAICVKNVAKQA